MEIKDNNILLIGNGFDLAHGLKTSYNDFLFLMKNWDSFYREYIEMKRIPGYTCKIKNLQPFLSNGSKMEDAHIEKLGTIIKENPWAFYFQNCGAEIDGWIDFEREMYPVLDLLEYICNKSLYSYETGYIPMEGEMEKFHGIARLLPKYVYYGGRYIGANNKFISDKYGVLKKKLLQALKDDLEEFILALEIYLYEFVHKKEGIKPLKQIADIHADCVISFNYTLTERIYGIATEDVHHLHGSIRKDASDVNNMVLGVNEREHQNLDFIYFVKYFQRIQKHCGTRYKKFAKRFVRNDFGVTYPKPYHLYIYGHSLDVTDEDILKYLIGDLDEYGRLQMSARQVTIFYYDQADFERKVINLVNLYGRSVVEEKMERDAFHFEATVGG